MMDILGRYQLKKVINVSGTMTSIGSSIVSSEIIDGMNQILPLFVNIFELQQQASRVIARVTGAQAGCVTSCAAAGIAVAVAASMTGTDAAKIELIPDTKGMRNEVIIQRGHMVSFGTSVNQMIRLAGAKVIEIGSVTRAGVYQLEKAITENTTAACYVVSPVTVQYGLIGLEQYCQICHEYHVPVIVDAASESNMRGFIEKGADIAVFSGHKFLAGPTSGVLAGRGDLIEACLLTQFHGIGRATKVGKEGIVGMMLALDRWESLDFQEIALKQGEIIQQVIKGLKSVDGLSVSLDPDPTGNPIERVTVRFKPGITILNAFHIVQELKRQDPPIYVRDLDSIDTSSFQIDPCNVTLDEAKLVVDRIRWLLARPRNEREAIKMRYSRWPNQADLAVQSMAGWTGGPRKQGEKA